MNPFATTTVVGRLAPTPSGLLHVGNARTFLVTWLAARAAGGRIVLRVEDIDLDRVRPAFERQQIEDLRRLGIDWDEGPDIGGPAAPYRQSERFECYRAALTKLVADGRVFPCVCSRREIDRAAGAPHEGEERFYPGTCRERFDRTALSDDLCAGVRVNGRLLPAAWRFRTEAGTLIFDDLARGRQSVDTHALVGDFVVYRKGDSPAYQLAVTVDDAAMGVTQVIRGDDLWASTARQLLLYEALELPPPREWAHLPLVYADDKATLPRSAMRSGSDGQPAPRRMAKRLGDLSLASLWERGVSPERLIGVLAHSLGFIDRPDALSARDLLGEFSWNKLRRDAWLCGPEVFGPSG